MADLQMYADHFLNELIDEAILGVSYEVHRSIVKGTLFLDESDPPDEEKYQIVQENGYDIFGQPISGSKKVVFECPCPNCHRNMAASRFAPHLEKCMGMGRNSSRIASQRIANSGKMASSINEVLGPDDAVFDDASNDVDWLAAAESSGGRKSKKRKAEGGGRGANSGSPRAGRGGVLSKASRNNSAGGASSATSSKQLVSTGGGKGETSSSQRTTDVNDNPSRQRVAALPTTPWQDHVNATLAVETAATGAKRSTKKIKCSKKNKKRQMVMQQSVAGAPFDLA